MKKITSLLFLLCLLIFPTSIVAQSASSEHGEVISAFRSFVSVQQLSIQVPTVVEVALDDTSFERFEFAVLNVGSKYFEPYTFSDTTENLPVFLTSNPSVSDISLMNDNDATTFAEFLLPSSAQGEVVVTIESSAPITSSYLTLMLAENVILPRFIAIEAEVLGARNKILLDNASRMSLSK